VSASGEQEARSGRDRPPSTILSRPDLLPWHISRLSEPLTHRSPLPGPRSLPVLSHADQLRIPIGPGALHVERYGFGGTPVVLLHGFGTSSFLWRWTAPLLARRGYTAFAIDLLGYGESDRPLDGGFGITEQVEYIDRAMTALRVARAVVVGLDIGAAVALALAAERPERVIRLVLVNPPDLDELPGDDVRSVQRNTARFALRASRDVLGVASLLTPLLEGGVADPDHMPPKLVGRYLAPYVGADGVSHLLSLARSLQNDDVEEIELAQVRVPVMVVWGEADRWADVSVADRLVAALPVAQLERVPDVGRLVPEEAPERLADLIDTEPVPAATGTGGAGGALRQGEIEPATAESAPEQTLG
jgi:pimeloyl-ACP methyl ester carboxylesterase